MRKMQNFISKFRKVLSIFCLIAMLCSDPFVVRAWAADSAAPTQTNVTMDENYGKSTVQSSNGDNGNKVLTIEAQQIKNNIGVNVFKQFDVKSGDVVNMLFQKTQSGQVTPVESLVNIMKGAAYNIAGEVNALYRQGQIGGSMFFLSDEGFILHPSGVMNVGSLFVTTPTTSALEDILKFGMGVNGKNGGVWGGTGEIDWDLLAGYTQNPTTIPVNISGTIKINGKINASADVLAQAGKELEVNGIIDAGNIVDFSDFVHIPKALGLSNESETVKYAGMDGNGDVTLSAYAKANTNSSTEPEDPDEHLAWEKKTSAALYNSVTNTATVKIGAGASITAKGAVNISATAETNSRMATNSASVIIGGDGEATNIKGETVTITSDANVTVNDEGGLAGVAKFSYILEQYLKG